MLIRAAGHCERYWQDERSLMEVAVRDEVGDVERERKDGCVRHHHHVRQEEVPRKATDVHMPRSCHDQISGCVLETLELSLPNPRKLGGARLRSGYRDVTYIQHRPHIRGIVLDSRKEETRVPSLFRINKFRTLLFTPSGKVCRK